MRPISTRSYRSFTAHGTSSGLHHPDESYSVHKTTPDFRLWIAKIAIHKCYIRSRLTYAAPARYALCSELQCQRLQTQQNIVLRMIAEAGWYLKNDVIARDLKVETLEELVRCWRGVPSIAQMQAPTPHYRT
ncbi:hypothetical protein EVAR_42819_1 [Eumeta japonica]|uniref:Uncharacterized protein n=1 Tax=Eumeta variegata TaxID=151549 RepID=A0A4C1WFK5_EUMVA|nr:hypothetical protein EVAR_42819_1 [Eumeta japonica]